MQSLDGSWTHFVCCWQPFIKALSLRLAVLGKSLLVLQYCCCYRSEVFISSWYLLVSRSYTSRNLCFFSFYEKGFKVFPNGSLNFLRICCNIPPFISHFVHLDLVSPLITLDRGLSILLLFKKCQLVAHCVVLLVTSSALIVPHPCLPLPLALVCWSFSKTLTYSINLFESFNCF